MATTFIDATLGARNGFKLTLANKAGDGLNVAGDPDFRNIEKKLGSEIRYVTEDACGLLRELGQGWTVTVDEDGTSVRHGDRIWLALPLGVGEWSAAYDAITMAISSPTPEVRERVVA